MAVTQEYFIYMTVASHMLGRNRAVPNIHEQIGRTLVAHLDVVFKEVLFLSQLMSSKDLSCISPDFFSARVTGNNVPPDFSI